MVYTLRKRIEIIFIYGEVGKCAPMRAFLFNEINRNCNVIHRYGLDLVTKFSKTGSMNNKKRNNPRVLNEEAQIEMLGTFAAEPISSLRSVAEQTGMSHETVRKALKIHKFHPYNMQIIHELHEDDYDRRMEF